MIPDLGVMIGFYVLTRMVQLRARTDVPPHVKTMALVTLIVTIVIMLGLMARCGTTP